MDDRLERSRLLEIERAALALLEGPTTPLPGHLSMVATDRLNWLKEACREPIPDSASDKP